MPKPPSSAFTSVPPVGSPFPSTHNVKTGKTTASKTGPGQFKVEQTFYVNPVTWQEHKTTWKICQLCDLCHTRRKVVLGRGNLPAPLLLVGEAPGDSEDVHGLPMWGPAGDLLQLIIDDSVPASVPYFITNLIGCVPKNDGGDKSGPPPEPSIKACTPRLQEIFRICSPKVLVCVGEHSKKWVPKVLGEMPEYAKLVKVFHVLHPAYLIRLDKMDRVLPIKQVQATLEHAALLCK